MTDEHEGIEMTECPECGYEMRDDDGFGFVYCRACGKCAHASYEGGICTICGEDDPSETRKAPTREEFDTLTAERDDLLQRHEFMLAINAANNGVIDNLLKLVKSYRQLWLDAKEATP